MDPAFPVRCVTTPVATPSPSEYRGVGHSFSGVCVATPVAVSSFTDDGRGLPPSTSRLDPDFPEILPSDGGRALPFCEGVDSVFFSEVCLSTPVAPASASGSGRALPVGQDGVQPGLPPSAPPTGSDGSSSTKTPVTSSSFPGGGRALPKCEGGVQPGSPPSASFTSGGHSGLALPCVAWPTFGGEAPEPVLSSLLTAEDRLSSAPGPSSPYVTPLLRCPPTPAAHAETPPR